ncbi:acyltransferase family protein [Chryseobacterium luquanense]|uniref:Acyltransferase n=1 Tax=Chryseobacterium luquanense TaxID=2983766 RepID=A0ABT3Y634_9FLAO|nr:acyltransferase [Chryseobacterium luquanense]MCX8533621.1 acyltransferase [Chryseobacterium luquanense]
MKLNNLQILRGISALLVCCFHFREDINFSNFKAGDALFKNGSIGVPIFFVISGFIMNYTTRKLRIQKNTVYSEIIVFIKKRAIRILPLYYLLTFLWIAVGGGLIYFQDKALLSRLMHSLLFLPQKSAPPVLFLGWSLNYEIFFYIVFGISLFFKQKRSLFITLFFIFFYILGHFLTIDNPFWMMITSSLNIYFIMGILLSIFLSKVDISKTTALLLSSSGIILFFLFFFNFINLKSELIIVGTVSGLVFSFLLGDYSLKIKGNKFLIFLGDISYSLYLSHPFVEVFFRRFKTDGLYTIPFFTLKIIFAIGVAAFLYYFIEKKVTYYLKTKLKV